MAQRNLLERALGRTARELDLWVTGRRLPFPGRKTRAERLDPEERAEGLARISEFYRPCIDDPDRLFPRAAPIAPSEHRVRSYGRDGVVVDLRWQTEFEPLWGDVIRDGYRREPQNLIAHARWFRHREGPRPCALLLHGYMSGAFAVEQRLWPTRWLFDLGFDVVFTTLPLHGLRRSKRRGWLPPAFPSADPRFTIEGFRQVVIEHVAWIDYLLAGRVASVGLMGMSLGGYAAALLGTVDERLAFMVPYIPLAAISIYAEDRSRLTGGADQQRVQRDGLVAAMRVVSPLARTPCIASDRVMVLAGEADGITGLGHAEPLAAHFGAPLVTFPGGHLLQVGRQRAFERVGEMLRRLGLATG